MSDGASGQEFQPHGLIVIQVDEAGHWSARLLDVDIHSSLAALEGLRSALVADHERLHAGQANEGARGSGGAVDSCGTLKP
jgi:hypothetical protein